MKVPCVYESKKKKIKRKNTLGALAPFLFCISDTFARIYFAFFFFVCVLSCGQADVPVSFFLLFFLLIITISIEETTVDISTYHVLIAFLTLHYLNTSVFFFLPFSEKSKKTQSKETRISHSVWQLNRKIRLIGCNRKTDRPLKKRNISSCFVTASLFFFLGRPSFSFLLFSLRFPFFFLWVVEVFDKLLTLHQRRFSATY